MMKNPKKYRVLKKVKIQGTTYSANVEVRLEAKTGDPLVAKGTLEPIA